MDPSFSVFHIELLFHQLFDAPRGPHISLKAMGFCPFLKQHLQLIQLFLTQFRIGTGPGRDRG